LELMQQHDLVKRGLVWSFVPMLLSVGAFVLALSMAAGARVVRDGLPFLVLVAVWIGGSLAMRLREERTLRSEVEELDAIAKENHQ